MTMKIKGKLIGLILLLTANLAGAEEFRFTGFYDYFGGIEPYRGYENLKSRVYMRPYFSGYDEDSGLEWVFSAKLWTDLMDETARIDPWDILDEAYLFLPAGNFDFYLGQRVLTYGFADVYGPLNMAGSANRAPLSLDEAYEARRPDPMFQVKFYPTFNDTLELAYVPVTRPDRERSDSVYLPDTKDTVIWSDNPYITDKLHNLFVSYSRYGEKLDWQFIYGNYVENTPDFVVPTVSSSTSVDITTEYNRKQTFGIAYSTGLWNTTLSQDFAFNLTDNLDGTELGSQNSDVTVNTQILANLPGSILSQTSIVYSYFLNYDKVAAGSDADATEYLNGVFHVYHTQPLEQIAFVVGHFERAFLRETLKTQLNVGYFFSPQVYLAPRAAFSISDYWAFETGADITLGDPPDADLRRNPSDDNYYVRLIYRY